MSATIAHIVRYPVKGFSPQPLETVELSPGSVLPFDRRYAVAHAASKYDTTRPVWLRKAHFLQLMRYEKLATLNTNFDTETSEFVIERDGRPVARGRLDQAIGRKLIEQFLNAYLEGAAPVPVKVIEMEGQPMTDQEQQLVSIINLASLRDLERLTRIPVDWRRFRGNVMIEGIPAWQEFDWVGSEVAIGAARGTVQQRIDRCAATAVNPQTGERDVNIVKLLKSGFDHIDCGVFVDISAGGPVRVGDTVEILP